MASRAETDVINFRTRLEKSLGVEDAPLEEFSDVLTALKAIPITIDILRKTKIGQTLQDVKKKHATNEVGALTKALLSKWKKDCEPPAAEGASSAATKVKAEPVATKAKAEAVSDRKTTASPSKGWGTLVSKDTGSSSKSNNEEEELMDEGMYDLLSVQRKQVTPLTHRRTASFISTNHSSRSCPSHSSANRYTHR